MWREPSNFYKDLGIDLKGREPSSVTAEEIDAAFNQAEAAHKERKTSFNTEARKFHPDAVRNSDEAKGLSPEKLEELIASKSEVFVRKKTEWEQHKAAHQKAESAYKGLKDPTTRMRHDETLKSGAHSHWTSGWGESRGGSASAGQSAGSGPFGENFRRGSSESIRSKLENFIKNERAQGRKPKLKDFNLNFEDLSGMDLEGCTIEGTLFHVNFKGANLKDANFSNRRLSRVLFDEATQLDGANFSNAQIYETTFPKILKNINFSHATGLDSSGLMNGKTFENCNFNGVYVGFKGCSNVTFKNCSFKNTDFSLGKMHNVIFEGGTVPTKLDYATLENVTFRNIESEVLDLTKARVKGLKIEGSIKKIKLGKEQIKEIDMTAAKVAELKILDFFGQEVKGAVVVDAAGHMQPVDPLKVFKVGVHEERSFVDRMIRTTEGKIHPGKVTAIAAGTVVLGAAAYQLSKRTLWKDRTERESSDERAAPSR